MRVIELHNSIKENVKSCFSCMYCRQCLIGRIGFGLLEKLYYHMDFIDGGNRMKHSWELLR